jgi:BRCA1-associated protein
MALDPSYVLSITTVLHGALVLLLDVISIIHNTTGGPMPSYFYHLLFELYTPRSPYCRSLSEFLHLSSQQLSCWIPPQTTDVFTADLPSHPKQRLPAHSDLSKLKLKHLRQTNKSKSKEKESQSNRHLDWRFGRVRVESIDMAPAATDGERRADTRGASPSPLTTGSAASKARFICLGGKNTEFGYGVVHLYRDEHETLGLTEAEQTKELDNEALTTVAILAVPSYMTPSDFVGFVGEGTRDAVSHIRMIRTGKANRYMVLMKFRDKDDARIFVKEFNGKVFNSMEVQCSRPDAAFTRANPHSPKTAMSST